MNIMNNNYSVLMSVYVKEKAKYLEQAMNSIWNQTIVTNDFVLVCDGNLNTELDTVIQNMEKKYPGLLHVIRLDKNRGLGHALNVGIKCCKNELIARMDSDDISRPERCERQIAVFSKMPHVSICSGTVEEFITTTNQIEAKRTVPEKQDEIEVFAKKRNPFNHPCVMYKKSAVELAGGYQDFYLLEDYYLWLRMIQNGCIGYNIQEPLLWMRAGSEMYRRRSGWKYAMSQKALFKYMRDSGFINEQQYINSVVMRTISSILPNGVRKLLFQTMLRDVS